MKSILPIVILASGIVASYQRNSDKIEMLEEKYSLMLEVDKQQTEHIDNNEDCMIKIQEHMAGQDRDIERLTTAVDRLTQENRAAFEAILRKLENP